ncbi:hypothetical protein [Coxiella burnetii]|uniref:hypothetical protein n=1 Tax=Coxiella burnetii TaxID=777 RepID=UPI0022312338|nr:hypothetical protein [Coxiella burnetii]
MLQQTSYLLPFCKGSLDRGQRTEDRGQWLCRYATTKFYKLMLAKPHNSVFSPLSPVFRLPSSVFRLLSSVLCPLSSVLCPLSSVLCPLSPADYSIVF